MSLIGPWTIRVCPDCGERVHDDATIHGCQPPGLYSYPVKVKVGPVDQPPGAVEENERLRELLRRTMPDVRPQHLREGILKALESPIPRGQ